MKEQFKKKKLKCYTKYDNEEKRYVFCLGGKNKKEGEKKAKKAPAKQREAPKPKLVPPKITITENLAENKKPRKKKEKDKPKPYKPKVKKMKY